MEMLDLKEHDFSLFGAYYREFRNLTYFNIHGFCPDYRVNLEKSECFL